MRILAIADQESMKMWGSPLTEDMKKVDLIISCGDLKAVYLEHLQKEIGCPLLYVRGNHDESYLNHPPIDCISIDGKAIEIRGLRVAGLGGSPKYREGSNMFTEREMKKRCRLLMKEIDAIGGIDILVTHSPLYGQGDMQDLIHTGFRCFEEILKKYQPKCMLYGHVHEEYGKMKKALPYNDGKTVLLNAFEYQIIEID